MHLLPLPPASTTAGKPRGNQTVPPLHGTLIPFLYCLPTATPILSALSCKADGQFPFLSPAPAAAGDGDQCQDGKQGEEDW